ncbi:MAG: PKD domain-containing protein, partial [Candidatus Thermoplasmatota archaeon]
IQNTRHRYRLHTQFEGCDASTAMSIAVSSLRGCRSIEVRCPISGDGYIISPLDDILWNITGAKYDKYSGRFQVLNNTLLQFDINAQYGYDFANTSRYLWDFGDGDWTSDVRPTHTYIGLGTYPLNLTVANATEDGLWFMTGVEIEVTRSPPIPVLEVYQEVNLTLTSQGRKGNSIGLQVFEDGLLLAEALVTRDAGPPDSASIVLSRYLGRTYEIMLIYQASHTGDNPVTLSFSCEGNEATFFYIFKTTNGYDQEVVISSDYLDKVTEGGHKFYFDASGSYDIDGYIVSYGWDFGDDTLSNQMIAVHIYDLSGEYLVRLSVMDEDGAVGVAERLLILTDCDPEE